MHSHTYRCSTEEWRYIKCSETGREYDEAIRGKKLEQSNPEHQELSARKPVATPKHMNCEIFYENGYHVITILCYNNIIIYDNIW